MQTHLSAAAGQFRRGQDVRQSSESMEQHGHELDNQNQTEEEHKYQTDRFQLQVLLRNFNLCTNSKSIINITEK